MCAKKIINERKITQTLNNEHPHLIGTIQWMDAGGGWKVYISDLCYALLVDFAQIKREGKLWNKIVDAVKVAGWNTILWENPVTGEQRVTAAYEEDFDKYLEVFECKYVDSEAKYTGEIREMSYGNLDIVKNGDGRKRGYDAKYIDIIKDKLVLREGTFMEGDLAPVFYRDANNTVSCVVMPVRM